MTRLFALITLCVAVLAPAYAADEVEVEEVPIEGESDDCYCKFDTFVSDI